MKRVFFFAILLCCCLQMVAQRNYIDSLNNELLSASRDFARQADIYANLCFVYRSVDIDSSEIYGRMAISVSKKKQMKDALAKAYTYLGYTYEASGRIDDAMAVADSAGIQLAGSKAYKTIFYNESLKATIYRRRAQYDSAVVYYMKSLEIGEQANDMALKGNAYNNLGILYLNMDDVSRAEEFHKQALDIRIQRGLARDIYQSYNNLGIVNREMKRYDKALEYYFKAMDYAVKGDDSSSIIYLYNDIGAAYSFKGNTTEAEKYLLACIRDRERKGLKNELAYTYNYLGENYERKKDLVHAEEYIKKALALAKEIVNNKQTYEAYESLSDFYARNGMYDSAYAYALHYKHFRDSIAYINNQKTFTELTAKYETAKKEKTIQLQQFEISKRNYWIAGISLMLLLGGVSVYSGYRRYRLKQQSRLQEAVLKQQEMATRAVIEAEENERKRIAGDLHDGVGQLMSAAKVNLSVFKNEISFLSEEQKHSFDKIISLVDDSCREVRAVSHNIMPNALIKNSLSGAIRDFINKIDNSVIEINLFAEGLQDKIDENTEIVLYRVLQECVNNVIKHSGANKLDISLIRDEDGISATIEDNGKGFDAGNKENFEGLGLKNIVTRIEYLKGTVEWDSGPGKGTVVTIHVPV